MYVLQRQLQQTCLWTAVVTKACKLIFLLPLKLIHRKCFKSYVKVKLVSSVMPFFKITQNTEPFHERKTVVENFRKMTPYNGECWRHGRKLQRDFCPHHTSVNVAGGASQWKGCTISKGFYVSIGTDKNTNGSAAFSAQSVLCSSSPSIFGRFHTYTICEPAIPGKRTLSFCPCHCNHCK